MIWKKGSGTLVSQGNGTVQICFDLRKACDVVQQEVPKDEMDECEMDETIISGLQRLNLIQGYPHK